MDTEKTLANKLKQYAEAGIYPFHMPGHKRNAPEELSALLEHPFSWDVTEVEGTDNLHHPEGIIRDAMDHAASLYHTRRTFFLVNGSTCGILAAFRSCLKPGEEVLIAQNAHISAWHATDLAGAKPVLLCPPVLAPYGFAGSVRPEDVKRALAAHTGVRAVFVTSPTYEGVLSDIAAIAEEAHRAGAVLIVDEAHGAHLNFLPARYRQDLRLCSAVEQGADLVIQSLHKTLPALTQTALLHVCTDRIDAAEVAGNLAVFETSSPSYVLLASADACIRWMESDGKMQMETYLSALSGCREALAGVPAFLLWRPGKQETENGSVYAYDPGRLVLGFPGKPCPGGPAAADYLRKEFRIETEMAAADYVILITGLCDTKEGFARLVRAVRGTAAAAAQGLLCAPSWRSPHFPEGPAKDYVFLYPPGIPVVFPGQTPDADTKKKITEAVRQGCRIVGLEQEWEKSIT